MYSPIMQIYQSGRVGTETHLGKGANRERYGSIQDELCPFPLMTFSEGTRDLPFIGDGHVCACISHPDHRAVVRLDADLTSIIRMVPRDPPCMGIARANNERRLSSKAKSYFLSRGAQVQSEQSKAFSRVHGQGLMPAVTTNLNCMDGRHGRCLHWREQRVLTVLEARRAQGVPDDEIMIGTAAQRWKVVGNAVHRGVAYVLGISLRESWEKSGANNGLVPDVGTRAEGRSMVSVRDSGQPGEDGSEGCRDVVTPSRKKVLVVVAVEV